MVTRNCLECQAPFKTRRIDVEKGRGKFCSRACCGVYNGRLKVVIHEPNVTCALCDVKFYKSTQEQKLSKSGLFFCSRAHKDEAQRIGGIEAIMPPHYGTSTAIVPEYRKKALKFLPNCCAVCGWAEYVAVLEVNHKNLDRGDNSLDNLEILCPTHHQVFHFLDGSGKWGQKKSRS
jgi:hypothetical protein